MTTYSYEQLKELWVNAGGPSDKSAMAAAVAMAESGGRSDAVGHNTNGTIDNGLWQINSIHGSQSTLDPLANARAAVSISQNGSTWRPWCTAWSNGACGGEYLGDGSPFKKFLESGASTGSIAGSNGSTSTTTAGLNLNPVDWVDKFLKTVGMWLLYGGMSMLGVLLIALGMFLLITGSGPGQKAIKGVGQVVGAVK
jgi:hypothetical protein